MAEWPPLRPLEAKPLPAFPVQALPVALRDWVLTCADFFQVPVDLPAILALAVVSAVCAKKARVVVRPDREEPINLYLMTVLPPGSRKTAVFNFATRPIMAAEEQQPNPIPAHSDVGAGRAAQHDDADAHSRPHEVAPPPTAPVVVLRNFSAPAIYGELDRNRGRVAILADEGELLRVLRSDESVTVLLDGHAGSSPLIRDRGDRPRILIREPTITIGLAVQPEVLTAMTSNNELRGRGLLGRFLFALPPNNIGKRNQEPPPLDQRAVPAYEAAIRRLLDLQPSFDRLGELVAHKMIFTEGARSCFRPFADKVEQALLPDGSLSDITDWGAKLSGAVARIAGLLALTEGCANGYPDEISKKTVNNAIILGKYFIKHATAALGASGPGGDLDDARRIVSHLQKKGEPRVTKRAIHQELRSRFPTAARLDAPLEILVDHGYLRQSNGIPGPRGGRPSRVFEVHPGVFTKRTKPSRK